MSAVPALRRAAVLLVVLAAGINASSADQPGGSDQPPGAGHAQTVPDPTPVVERGPPGDALFRQKCTGCHLASRPLSKVRAVAEAERAAYLERFLGSHFCPDAGERKAITQYLVSEAGRQ
jgi:hypothetical protein